MEVADGTEKNVAGLGKLQEVSHKMSGGILRDKPLVCFRTI